MVKDMPLLSLILPIYNVEPYLERCFESILKQNIQNYEMILVDDGSTDNSPAICDRFVEEHSNARVIHKVNGGLSSARNAGVLEATGEYIFFIDSDDWIAENALKILDEQLAGSDIDVLKFNYISMPQKTEGNSIVKPGLYKGDAIRKELIPLSLKKTGSVNFSAWTHVYRRQFLLDNQMEFVSERRIGSEDYLFNLNMLACADSVKVITDHLYYYDYREGSLTNRYRENIAERYDELHRLFVEVLKKYNLYEDNRKYVAYSYVEKTFSVIILNECVETKDHSLFDGWKNSRRLLKNPMFREFLKDYPYEEGRKNRKVLLTLMKWRIASVPMFLILRKQKRIKR